MQAITQQRVSPGTGTAPGPDDDLDPIEAQILRHRILAIPRQIELNITRTAYSPLIYETKDYSVGLVDHEGRLICESIGGIPLFSADALGVGVRDGLAIHGPEGMHPGDVIISNHAGTLGQHLNNVIMYTPIFVGPDNDQLFGFMAITVHWVDIGGWAVGSSAPAGTTSIFQEGFQFRSVKLWSRGERVEDIYRTIQLNTRFLRELMGDIEAQLAGCLLGRDMFAELVQRYSAWKVRAAIDAMWDAADASSRAAVRRIPDGVYSASSQLDDDGTEFGKPVKVDVVVKVEDDRMTVDLSGVADQVKGSINSGRFGGAMTAARIAFRFLCSPSEPGNDGTYRALRLEIPDGKFLSASGDAAMSKYSSPLPLVIDTIIKALAPAIPEQVSAGHHGNFGVHTIVGVHPTTGERFSAHTGNYAGWGALHDRDGAGPYKTMAHGDTPDAPVEQLEQLYPVRVILHRVRPDSAGAGEYRGGMGFEKIFEALAPCSVQLNFERTTCPPWGLFGGKAAATPHVTIERADGRRDHYLKGTFPLAAGDRLQVLNSGGGGYGNPFARDPQAVAADYRRGFVTRDGARDDYGVVLDQSGSVDPAATAERRAGRGGDAARTRLRTSAA